MPVFALGGRHVTRRFGGPGLGLAINAPTASAHGGAFTASSDAGKKGTTLNLTLPLRDAAAGHERGLSILLVEDHADTAVVLTRLLRKMGHSVIHATTVADALRMAEAEIQGAGLDLVISDVGLPDGSGLDMMRKLLASGPIKGIALSGFGMDSDIVESHAAGFSRHLVKPVSIAALRKAILELMQKR
jgi:CheY-like chemotaxis protein